MSQTQQLNFVEIEALYREFGQPAYNLAFRLLGNSEAAEDVVQAVFLDYWHSPRPLENEEFRGWLLQAVHQKCLGRQVTILPKILPSQSIQRALATLPADQQELLELAYFTGQNYRQLAEKLRLPVGTVKSSLIQSLIQLKKSAYEN